MQGLPVNERMHTCPQLLSLPMPGSGKAYHHNCAEYRLVPGGGPVDYPASQPSKVAHAGSDQVDHTQEERDPPVEEHGSPGAWRHPWGMPDDLVCALLLRLLWLFNAIAPVRHPKSNQLVHVH